jgi:ectoine hydroxylase-related dioxygenase (phytanoyl-CoA dioxygenase family)
METMFCESVQRSMDVGTDDRAAVCEAWLGPSYQITGTLNATFAGGIQQEIHRDYRKSDIIVKADR